MPFKNQPQRRICSLMIRIGTFLVVFLVTPATAAKVDIAYCTQVHDAAAARLKWALVHQHDNKLQASDSCRSFRSEFYNAAVTRQNVTKCEQDDIRERALKVIDAEIDAFNDLIANSCGE
jgi:hypothetical protein